MSAFGGMSNVVGLSSGINTGATGAAASVGGSSGTKSSGGGGGGGGKIIEALPMSTAAKTAMEHQFPEPKVHFDGASLHTSWLNAHKARHGIKNEYC